MKSLEKKYKERLDVSDINPVLLFMVLFNLSKQQGYGVLDGSGRNSMTYSEAHDELFEHPLAIEVGRKERQLAPTQVVAGELFIHKPRMLDYVRGRVMKCTINGKELDTWGYDRDNGEGAAAEAVAAARELQKDIQNIIPCTTTQNS